jgi:tRNA 2-selenouridine synthase
MTLKSITAEEAIAGLGNFDTIIDARSPAEYADDHLPGAVNWPVLDDDERREVGTEYKQISAFDARKHGAAIVARRVAEIVERHVADKPREWQPLVYCWRGGQRSGTLAWFLGQIGFRVQVLHGGYKAFREQVREQLKSLPQRFEFTVIAGRTGSGKTRLLQALIEQGAQVLDLEALACHRGSVLGGLPHDPQPTQKAFDTAVWQTLQGFDPSRPVFVESESRKIGALAVPEALLSRMRAHGRCVFVTLPDAARVQLLLEEYGFFAQQVDRFCEHMVTLTELRGKETVTRWQTMAREGQWAEVFAELMQQHYDPLYLRSMQRNFAGMATAQPLALRDGDIATLREAAATVLAPQGLRTTAAWSAPAPSRRR